MSTRTTASVSTHILDTSVGRPARGVAVRLEARTGRDADWQALGGSMTDADGRCKDLPALPEGTTHVRLDFAVEPYFTTQRADAQQDAPANRDSGTVLHPEGHSQETHPQETHPQESLAPEAHSPEMVFPEKDSPDVFFPEVAITFAVRPGEHYHVPLLLNPFGYSVYRGS
ncbi:hydroxyisourate hydrolase [Streptomyces sp. NPDC004610]|uniref:hydroxyisourate hydrolase n=1 Tax=unclassified Streptomyces TaxID=2593676 RepID=UPI0033AE441C